MRRNQQDSHGYHREVHITKLKKDGNNINLVELNIVGINEVKQLLKTSKVLFILDNARMIRWISEDETFEFWKNEVETRIVEPKEAEEGFQLEDYPEEYCYIARKCRNSDDEGDPTSYIILQTYH